MMMTTPLMMLRVVFKQTVSAVFVLHLTCVFLLRVNHDMMTAAVDRQWSLFADRTNLKSLLNLHVVLPSVAVMWSQKMFGEIKTANTSSIFGLYLFSRVKMSNNFPIGNGFASLVFTKLLHDLVGEIFGLGKGTRAPRTLFFLLLADFGKFPKAL